MYFGKVTFSYKYVFHPKKKKPNIGFLLKVGCKTNIWGDQDRLGCTLHNQFRFKNKVSEENMNHPFCPTEI